MKTSNRSLRAGVAFGPALLIVSCLLVWPAVSDQAHAEHRNDACARLLKIAEGNARLDLNEQSTGDSCYVEGTYRVFENRAQAAGREIDLHLIILPALSDDALPDPVFVLHGGPGAAATTLAPALTNSWLREHRDIVLVDQRGTGESNPLRIPGLNRADDLQSYLEPMFRVDVFQAALPELAKIADVRQYTTPLAMDDLNEIRAALGYKQINLRGGSYGSRAALVYMRQHPETVRTATLQGLAPIAFRNPLYHARAAQDALNLIFEECRSERYRDAFPDLEAKFQEVLDRLEKQPAEITLRDQSTGDDIELTLTRDAFAESIRVLMYTTGTSRQVPRLIMDANAGDYRSIAAAGLANVRRLRNLLAFGMLISVTASEDISRIDPAEVQEVCAGTFLGDARVRQQMAVAAVWPKGEVPPNYGDPVNVDVPVLLFSGTIDPVTPPKWGQEAASHLPNSLHVVVPGGHGVGGSAVQALEQQFLETASVEDLDLSDVRKMELPPLELPPRERADRQ